jgi:hypothetical protein
MIHILASQLFLFIRCLVSRYFSFGSVALAKMALSFANKAISNRLIELYLASREVIENPSNRQSAANAKRNQAWKMILDTLSNENPGFVVQNAKHNNITIMSKRKRSPSRQNRSGRCF